MVVACETKSAIRQKVEWAKNHISNLDKVIDIFGKQHPYKMIAELDKDTGHNVYRFVDVADLPPDIPMLVGDAVHNLRSALDHIAWGLFKKWCVDAASVEERTVQFPIYDSREECEARLPGKVNMFGKDGVKFISQCQPYRGGNDTLWRLHRLDIIDKHRLLLTMSAYAGADYTFAWQDSMDRFVESFPQFRGVPKFRRKFVLPFKGTDSLIPAKNGEPVLSVPPGQVLNKNMEICVIVAFDEADIIQGQSILVVLDLMVNIVEGIAIAAESLL